MIRSLQEFAAYNLWANERFVRRFEQEEEEAVLDHPAPGSFPSVRATLLHIRDAENAWWCRLNGVPAPWPAHASGDIGTLLPCSRKLVAFVNELTTERAEQVQAYHDLRGNAHEQTAWRMLLHCFNHSTQHRGQLITMMRVLQLDMIPANDLVRYQREHRVDH